MPHIILTAEVEDPVKWAKGFRTHDDLFRQLGMRVMYYTVTPDHHVAMYSEVDDLETYFEIMQEPVTQDAMAMDGVIPESVRIDVLDREWKR